MARRNGYMWWIDRWRKSTAYTDMTLEEQGAYRNLLDEATLRGGALPNLEHVLTKACGDPRRWAKVRTAVLAHFVLGPDGCWHNETLDLINAKSAALSADRSVSGALGNGRKWGVQASQTDRKPIANASQTVSQTHRKTVAKGIANLSPPDQDQDLVQKDPPSESLSAPPRVFDLGFSEFWDAYPRKVGKDAAKRAYLKRHPDAELHARMLAAIDRQARDPAWRKDGGQFVPHPATWLNAGRWEDEPAAGARAMEPSRWQDDCTHDPPCTNATNCANLHAIEAYKARIC